MEEENFLGCLPHMNWQTSGAPAAPPVMNCPPSDQLQPCFISLNWDQPVNHSAAALSSMVSSPSTHSPPATAANSVAIRELIGRLGGICNSGDISPHSHQWSNALNSPPELNLSMMEHHQLQLQAQGNLVMPGSLLQAASQFGQFPAGDSGFAERAARLSCLGGSPQTFGGIQGQFVVPGTGNQSRLTRNQSMNDGRSHMGVQENNNEIPMLSRSSTPEAREDSSASDHTMITDNSGKKRKATSTGKAREMPMAPLTENLAKVGEEDGQNAKRSKQTEAAGKIEVNPEAEGSGGEKAGKASNSKAPEPPKDYIHVRARRGQATDSHSLAERVRREKISERMKFLQNLVPGCNKVTGKAVMLDEIINYVQSLQRQVEFLSMKLATVNPPLEIGVENLLQKDMQQPRGSVPLSAYTMENSTPAFPFAPIVNNRMESHCSVNPLDSTLRQSLSGQLPSLHGCSDAGSQAGPFWDDDLHSVIHMGINQNQEGGFPSQPFQVKANCLRQT